MNFDFDEEKLKKEQDDNADYKNRVATMGSIADLLSSQNSVGNYALGQLNQKSTAGSSMAKTLGDNAGDPTERRAKLYAAFKQSKEAGEIKKKEDEEAQEKDSGSRASLAAQLWAKQNKIKGVQDGMSAYEIKKLYDIQKYNNEQAKSQIDHANDRDKIRYQHELNMKDAAAKMALEEELKPPTDAQSKSAGYAQRMSESDGIIDGLIKKGYSGNDFTAAWDSTVPNFAATGKGQSYNNAKKNFITANLRSESGAVISPQEEANEDKKYFPQPGDTAEMIQQKGMARRMAMAAMKSAAGRASKRLDKTLAGMPEPITIDPGFKMQGAKAKAPADANFVSIKDPNGVVRKVPKSMKEKAIKAGGTLVDGGI